MIPVNEPLIGEKEIEYVNECLRTGWISSAGAFIEAFEASWAAYCGRRYGIAMSNGTTALQAAVASFGFEPGFLVVMPSFTIISCALSVIYNGGIPVLVDCDPQSWCMNVKQVEDIVEKDIRDGDRRIKAIMPVHIYGHPVDMDPIIELAEKYNLILIEDAAEVHGAEYLSGRNTSRPKWKRCGSFGHVSVFSFYANKLITTGEGGMVLTDDLALAKKARELRNLCFQPGRRFLHDEMGHNFRLTNLQAAIGLAQIERMDEILAHKHWMGHAYTQRLKDLPGLRLPVEEEWARQVYWMYGIVLDETTGLDAETLAAALKEKGVETRPFFIGMHEQPAFRKMGLFENDVFPVTENISRQGLYLPSGLAITERQIEEVVMAVKSIIRESGA